MEGASFREFPNNGKNVIVHPIFGRDLENLEKLRMELEYQKGLLAEAKGTEEKRKIAKVIRRRETQISMYSVLAHIDMPGLGDAGSDELSRRPLVEKYIKEITPADFTEFFGRVKDCLDTMSHGLNMVESEDGQLHLLTPLIQCENHPESDGVRLRFQFRTFNIIPYI